MISKLGLIFDGFSSFCDDQNDENLSNMSPNKGIRNEPQ